jgi:peptide/nickel transport system permease protein
MKAREKFLNKILPENTKIALRLFVSNPLGKFSVVILAFVFLMAVLAPVISPYNPFETDPAHRLLPPSLKHPFGTDQLGRDILSRVIWGSRVSLSIAILSVLITSSIGITIGIISGYFGGQIDNILMRITDMFMAFPRLVLALAFAAALGPSVYHTIIAIALVYWSFYARLARGVALQIRNEQYIEAAHAIGASNARIIFLHVLPMITTPLLVQITLDLGGMILLAAGLGFLGLGVQPPTPEWGVMVSEGRKFITQQWWVSTFPGLFILISTLGFNLAGDALRDAFDVKIIR